MRANGAILFSLVTGLLVSQNSLVEAAYVDWNSFNRSVAILPITSEWSPQLGDGVYLTGLASWLSPSKPSAFGLQSGELCQDAVAGSADYSLDSSESQVSKAQKLYGYFGGSYGLSSVNSALAKLATEDSTSESLFIEIERSGDGARIDASAVPQWSGEALQALAVVAGDSERADALGRQYGSHYVERVRCGFRIVVHVQLNTSSREERTEFAARLSASLAAVKANGGVSNETRDWFSNKSVSIKARLQGEGPEPVFLTVENVLEYFGKIRDQEIEFGMMPVTAHVRSFNQFLDTYPELARITGSGFSGAPSYPCSDQLRDLVQWPVYSGRTPTGEPGYLVGMIENPNGDKPGERFRLPPQEGLIDIWVTTITSPIDAQVMGNIFRDPVLPLYYPDPITVHPQTQFLFYRCGLPILATVGTFAPGQGFYIKLGPPPAGTPALPTP